MSGITVGPRQFNFMIPGNVLQGTALEMNDWSVRDTGSAGLTYYIDQKLDLRGLNAGSDSSRGLNPIAFALQEANPWYVTNNAGILNPHCIVYDIVSTVQLNIATIAQMFSYPASAPQGFVPGFLGYEGNIPAKFDGKTPQQLNSSQVIWGRWREWNTSKDFSQGTNVLGTRGAQSGTFGSGEVMVSNDAYYTRIVFNGNDGNIVYAPATNLAVWAEVISLTEGQELTQLSRMVQR